MMGVAEATARLDERCRRAEYEYPRLAAPDGTVAVPIGDLRLLLNAQGIGTLAERVLRAHEWGYRDLTGAGFVEHNLPFQLAEAVLAQRIEAGTAETAQPVPCEAREPDPEGDAPQ